MDPGALTTDGDGRLPRILVVDDSRMVRASIVKHIRGRFEAREEPDGEAAWEALLVDPAIEIVLTDIGMPRLDGYGLLGRLRASKLPRVRDLPVVIISGDEDESARARALALGANGFVTKGTGGVELLATLMSLLRLSKAQGELERSRAALERQSPVDPESGLATEAYLEHHGAQAVAEARRRQADIGAMVIEIDQFDELATRYGVQVVQLILRKLGKLVSGRIRAEDTLSQHGQACFALLSPGIDRVSTCAFALRLRASVEKLFYLPEAHTDFIMAVIAEEFGFVGICVLIGLYGWIVRRAFHIGMEAKKLERYYASLVAQGIGVWLGIQTFFNIGVNMGLLPTKGLTLPLMSFGGSAMVMNMVALAVLLRVDYENRRVMRGYKV